MPCEIGGIDVEHDEGKGDVGIFRKIVSGDSRVFSADAESRETSGRFGNPGDDFGILPFLHYDSAGNVVGGVAVNVVNDGVFAGVFQHFGGKVFV